MQQDLSAAFTTMLGMQSRMNQRIHPDWISQGFAWHRAIWIECGELIEHQGYKWWKKQTPDVEQVQLEVIDIWHFGMSALFRSDASIDTLARDMAEQLQGYVYPGVTVIDATEALAAHALNTRGFSVPLFWDLLHAAGLDFDALYRQYVGKNVLNFFRQDHGYKDGTYIKQWQGREDNEHLVEILADLDSTAPGFSDNVYAALADRYRSLAG